MHGERLDFWTKAYGKEKSTLLQQYADEMDSYKDRKFRAHKELECVHHGLEALADQRQKSANEEHDGDVYGCKSKVSSNESKHHDVVGEILTIGFGPFRHAIGNGLSRIAFVVLATIVVVHLLEHVETLLNRIDEKLFQLNVTNTARQHCQHFDFVWLIVSIDLWTHNG